MDNPMFLLMSSFVISGVESIHCYFITNNLVGNKVKYAFKAFSYKDMFLVGSHAIFSLSTLFFVSSSNFEAFPTSWQNAIFLVSWAITSIILVLVVIRVMKNKSSSITVDEVVLIFLICFVFNKIISTVVVMPIIATMDFILNRLLMIAFLCVASVVFTIAFLWPLDKVDMNKLFIFVAHRLALKLAIFMITSISFTVIFFGIYFSASLESLITILILIPLGISAILLIIGFVHTLRAAHQYEVVVPEKYHEMKRILTLLNLKAENVQTVGELRETISATIELMGIKTVKAEVQTSVNEPEDFEAFITSTINSLKLNHKSNVDINTSIQFFEPHKNVSAMTISYMLGTLLENAIETGTEYPIVVDILSTEHVLFIKVANEAELKTPQELYNMLSKGYSTKEKVGRGFGLSKLKKLVENHQGNIIITQEMNPNVKTHYITFTLNF